jgi:hypothetical protein
VCPVGVLQVGNHSFTVKSSTGATLTAVNNPLELYVSAAASSADASSFTVNLASLAVGDSATVAISLRDRLGAPLSSAAAARLLIQGEQAVSTCC